ncbi:uncharacterized protein RAG0_03658 [Rhynchosporium agropyri]|uniref:Uncharacterized protein n=1 Tax=Rhynchosporium agropyri TaxID=914238 RepID=A0A1E1K5C5_9HELO|nr:uncharacterized protein RAG0_03658 [Rhynchosporium agropyri]
MSSLPEGNPSFSSIYNHLTDDKRFSAPLLPPAKPHSTTLTSQIASLQLHPSLEAALHLLNADLPSAHFLVRHMQSAPKYEGMYLHGILHRIEGDLHNARCWYSDVNQSEVYRKIWAEGKTFKDVKDSVDAGDDAREWMKSLYGLGGEDEGLLDEGQKFLNRVQAFQQMKAKDRKDGERAWLEKESMREISRVIEWCMEQFGVQKWEDASSAWVKDNEEIKGISQEMTSGGKGYRKF